MVGVLVAIALIGIGYIAVMVIQIVCTVWTVMTAGKKPHYIIATIVALLVGTLIIAAMIIEFKKIYA